MKNYKVAKQSALNRSLKVFRYVAEEEIDFSEVNIDYYLTDDHWIKEQIYKDNELPSSVSYKLLSHHNTFDHIERNKPDWYYFYSKNKVSRMNGPAGNYHDMFFGKLTHYWLYKGTRFDEEAYFTFLDDCGIDINCMSEDDLLLINIWMEQ